MHDYMLAQPAIRIRTQKRCDISRLQLIFKLDN